MKSFDLHLKESIENVRCSFGRDYWFLNTFYSNPIEFEGFTFANAECAYQWAVHKDWGQAWLKFCLRGHAGSVTREVHLRMKDKYVKWKDVKYRGLWDDFYLMYDIQRIKFQGELLDKLKATSPHDLIYWNTWHEYYWGVHRKSGLNKLGIILMEIRSGDTSPR